jgi:hypothetical protein
MLLLPTLVRRRFLHCCLANNIDHENAQTQKLAGLSDETHCDTIANADPTTTHSTHHISCISDRLSSTYLTPPVHLSHVASMHDCQSSGLDEQAYAKKPAGLSSRIMFNSTVAIGDTAPAYEPHS